MIAALPMPIHHRSIEEWPCILGISPLHRSDSKPWSRATYSFTVRSWAPLLLSHSSVGLSRLCGQHQRVNVPTANRRQKAGRTAFAVCRSDGMLSNCNHSLSNTVALICSSSKSNPSPVKPSAVPPLVLSYSRQIPARNGIYRYQSSRRMNSI